MKSHCITVCFSAWLLGVDPGKKIIAASYNQQLSNNFLSQVKTIMKSQWYKTLFSNSKILKGSSQRHKILTTQNGFRFATSISGTLTGEGADVLIIDDPHKPLDISNQNSRKKVHEWFDGTFSSRLNDKKNGAIIVVMQRLHQDDLVAYLSLKSNFSEWKVLNLELESTQDCLIKIDNFSYYRKKFEPLHIDRQNSDQIKILKQEVGEQVFNSQYQQNPINTDGGIIKKSWIIPYKEQDNEIDTNNETSSQRRYFISIDAAVKSSISNDFTAITIWYCKDFYNTQNAKYNSDKQSDFCVNDKICNKTPLYLYDVINQKLSYPEIVIKICDLIKLYKPHGIVIEDAASGSQLIQHLKNVVTSPLYGKVPTRGKETRLTFASLFFEKKLIHLNIQMSEYYTTVNQLLCFPKVKNDDICDSISMFINWFYDYYEPNNITPKIENLKPTLRSV
jgi:predicted phage terminase large subunit-like protein